jgi:hypothetical protein
MITELPEVALSSLALRLRSFIEDLQEQIQPLPMRFLDPIAQHTLKESVGSSIRSGWNRRSSAPSFSIDSQRRV